MRYLVLLAILTSCTALLYDERIAFKAGPTYKQAVACSLDERMLAANMNFTAGCLLTALDMCSDLKAEDRNSCYDKMQARCSISAKHFEEWLRNGR